MNGISQSRPAAILSAAMLLPMGTSSFAEEFANRGAAPPPNYEATAAGRTYGYVGRPDYRYANPHYGCAAQPPSIVRASIPASCRRDIFITARATISKHGRTALRSTLTGRRCTDRVAAGSASD